MPQPNAHMPRHIMVVWIKELFSHTCRRKHTTCASDLLCWPGCFARHVALSAHSAYCPRGWVKGGFKCQCYVTLCRRTVTGRAALCPACPLKTATSAPGWRYRSGLRPWPARLACLCSAPGRNLPRSCLCLALSCSGSALVELLSCLP